MKRRKKPVFKTTLFDCLKGEIDTSWVLHPAVEANLRIWNYKLKAIRNK